MATLTVVPQNLFQIEDSLQALIDTQEMVPADMEQAFVADLTAALTTAIDKRDRVGSFLAHLESQIIFADTEIQRLQERKAWYARVLDKMESYVIRVLQSREADAKGKYPKLEGRTTTFSLRALPAKVEYREGGEALVPLTYKTLTIKLPAERWEQLLDSLDVDTAADVIEAVKKAEVSIDKRAVKAALEAEVPVPGAYLGGATVENRRYTLVRK